MEVKIFFRGTQRQLPAGVVIAIGLGVSKGLKNAVGLKKDVLDSVVWQESL